MYNIEPTEESVLTAWNYCEKEFRSVEIVYRDEEVKEGVLTRVHFNVNPVCVILLQYS